MLVWKITSNCLPAPGHPSWGAANTEKVVDQSAWVYSLLLVVTGERRKLNKVRFLDLGIFLLILMSVRKFRKSWAKYRICGMAVRPSSTSFSLSKRVKKDSREDKYVSPHSYHVKSPGNIIKLENIRGLAICIHQFRIYTLINFEGNEPHSVCGFGLQRWIHLAKFTEWYT